ncbi:MFS transporter [Micromonospora sp. M12]
MLITGVSVVGLAAILASFSDNIVQLSVLRGVWGWATRCSSPPPWWCWSTWPSTGSGWSASSRPLRPRLRRRSADRRPARRGQLAAAVLRLRRLHGPGLGVASRKLREPTNRQAPVRVGQIFATYRRPAFIALCVVTAAYNFVFFVVLGYTPLFLGLDVIPLGLAFTGWGLGLAAGIMVIGHRLAHRIGAVQTVGVAIAGLLVCMVLFATSTSTAEALVVLVLSGLCMGWPTPTSPTWPSASAPATVGWPPERSTWSAGAAAPAPIISGKLAEQSLALPFWVGFGCWPSVCSSTWRSRT